MFEFDPSEGVVIFTDGSAWIKDRSGGWSFVAIDVDRNVAFKAGGVDDTTNNRMELEAPTQALLWLAEKFGSCPLIAVYSDSEYVVKGYNARQNRKRTKNLDLWADLEEASGLHKHVEFHHVKGHADNEYNELADKLAGEARRGQRT